ncbi:MAG: hypothetical protein R3346_02055 [Candidatus Spechtbacterales bacterium]|nr:hypothetical protein [Candidatus Spechtbacterales bacterium]
MSRSIDPLELLERELISREQRPEISYSDYLELVNKNPRQTLRSIFQLFLDMVNEYVAEEDDGVDKDPESIGFTNYDCSQLFIEGADNPFFADTPFANRFVRQAGALTQGTQQNRVYVYDGPSGCGKSTFMNNILRSFQAYTRTPSGRTYEIVWDIDGRAFDQEDNLRIPCPSHDYPILLIPKNHRKDFLKNLLEESALKKSIFSKKEYSWVLQSEPCTICRSIFWELLDKLGSVEHVLEMVKVRAIQFNRRTGDGISVFNPGDKLFNFELKGGLPVNYHTDDRIQVGLDRFFGPGAVQFAYSHLASTNNGIYVLMDVKGNNKERLLELHNVVSEGVHRIGGIEEQINSLFFALMNPEDRDLLKEQKMESFKGRIHHNNISYVLEPETESSILRNIFGANIDERFLPMVLENFARVIISSRMKRKCEPQEEWIDDMKQYELYCDKDGLLLRMSLYSNIIPTWLSEKDKKSFTAPVRRAVIAQGQDEGLEGFSGRESIELFREFLSTYSERGVLINMGHVLEFFKHKISRDRRNKHLPPRGFLDSLLNSYDYAVLNQAKEALYNYRQEQIEKDILHYLSAVNYDVGNRVYCEYTGEEFELEPEFLLQMARHFTGKDHLGIKAATEYSDGVRAKYVPLRASSEQNITDTPLFEELYKNYMRSLKKKVMDPLIQNKNFSEAVRTFGTAEFSAFDKRLKAQITRLITNLQKKFGYSREGAKEICIYILEKELVKKFS